jgi:hypothetical protein
MATVLQLVGTTTVDLYGGTFQLARNGWSSRTTSAEYNYNYSSFGAQARFQHHQLVLEQLVLHAKDTDTNIITAYRNIYSALEGARRYHADKFDNTDHWLQANTANETVRQALIYGGSIQINSSNVSNPLMTCSAATVDLVIERHPFWENTGYTTLTDTNLGCTGDTYEFSDIPGDVPARIARMRLSASTGGPLTEFWAGIRPRYRGFPLFDPSWECEDGTVGTDASTQADVTASGNDKVQVSFATTTTMAKRWEMTCAQAYVGGTPSQYDQFNGSYKVLVRCQVSSGTIGLRMRSGFDSTPDEQLYPAEEVYIENTSWMLVDLGHVSIPPAGQATAGLGEAEGFRIVIYAERIDGSGTLDLDLIILIPDRHMVHVSGCSVVVDGGNTQPVDVWTLPNDIHLAVGYEDDYPAYDVTLTTNEWHLPASPSTTFGDSLMVIAGQRASSHDLNDDVDLNFRYVPRWATYRS